MTRKKRVYNVLLATTATKIIQVRAYSKKEAATVIYDKIEDEDQIGLWGTMNIGDEFVVDITRAGQPWPKNEFLGIFDSEFEEEEEKK